ncbi:hypothetical protein N7539_000516 [Penicillium diatomitis]|uniref:Filamentation protein n=1 Tax=Penicillium diatomitis TaxID=2819901 RepID=A0A9X0C2Q5_9EURO|nr:uncharacterized protein N7539_000516 [Penicillium diatomitis]KAJ5495400.1 hypothetical protein N7539_000516 [Penicillium diatomitis]
MAGGNADKGQRYITSLDQARAQGRWDEVPELIRKIRKHAPTRTCAVQTATAESQVVAYLQQKSSTEKPLTPNLTELIPGLLTVIDTNDGTPEEILQAQVCLGWIHWILSEPALAVERLPQDLVKSLAEFSAAGQNPSSWTEICLVRGCYIKGAAQVAITGMDESLETFAALSTWLSDGRLGSSNPQFLSWAEALLSKGAIMASDETQANSPDSETRHVEIALRLFRLWAALPAVKQGLPPQKPSYLDAPAPHSRCIVWKAYYGLLTTVLQDGLPYTASREGNERLQLASEIRRVEFICENSVIRDATFPNASSDNAEIETWVEKVIANWEIMCGPHWQDHDLGEGGQVAMGRNVLDILYRAASKTYHSHLILRRLFHVHSALTDFELAIQALDSYIDIVTGAMSRAEKGAEYGELEKPETFLQTLSEGVVLLSCLGSFDEAEKAKSLTELIRSHLEKHGMDILPESSDQTLMITERNAPSQASSIDPVILASTYRAVGIGLANWANFTPQNEARDEIRSEAVDYLMKSASPSLGKTMDYSTLYTLSLVLAENRDLDTAIEYVKSALTSHGCSETTEDYSRERDLLPMWHLLALLLSAKNEFDIAERSCQAAFDPLPSELLGKSYGDRSADKRLSRPSSNPKDRDGTPSRPFVSRLHSREKERMLQLRITQLSFVEVMEGPEAAVNQSGQLLHLFATLFHDLNLDSNDTEPKADQLVPPKSSAGTTRSFRGSIFSRHRASHLNDRRAESSLSAIPPVPPIPNGMAGAGDAPSIQITREERDGRGSPSTLGRSDSHKVKKRASSILKHEKPRNEEHPPLPTGPMNADTVDFAVSAAHSTQATAHPVGMEQSSQAVAHSMPVRQKPVSAGHDYNSHLHDVRLPRSHRFNSPTFASMKFSHARSQKHALGLLVQIWLVIAGLYRRAGLFDDAREACQEALKQASRVETLTASFESSARAFSKRGWDNAKSSDELWADVLTEQGLLSQSQSKPHQAMKIFEEALLRCPDHPTATIALANLLLDLWDQKLPLESSNADVDLTLSRLSLLSILPKPKIANAISIDELKRPASESSSRPGTGSPPHDVDPKHLHRLAARDRAYGLLSSLTKLGSSWDNSDAWFALSRAYEAGEQIDKLKDVLWWCIELEDRRPIRHWSTLGSGLYVL